MWMRSAVFLLLLSCATAAAAGTFESAPGITLWYESVGRGTPVIVIHGGPGLDHSSLAADLRPLERKHRVIYYDQRGGGRSSLPDDDALLHIDRHVDDVEALRKHLGLTKVTLLAHSFGPAIAALYAIRHPGNVERMIFLGPIPPRKAGFFEAYEAEMGKRLTREQLVRMGELAGSFGSPEADAAAACREFWSIGMLPRVSRTLSASVVKADLCTAPPGAIRFGMTRTNRATWRSLGDWDWTDALAKLHVPTLVIHGDEDMVPHSLVAAWIGTMPEARMLRLKDTGHFPHAERPDLVFPAIERFMKGRWPAGATR